MAFREQVHKHGAKVIAGDMDRVVVADVLERWIFRNAVPLAHSIIRDWVRSRLDDWLRARLREQANSKLHPPAEEALFDLLDDMPERIEVGIGRFIDRLEATRPQIRSWQRLAHVKRANIIGYCEKVDRVAARLLPMLTDDQTTVREVLRPGAPAASNGRLT